MNKKNKIFFQVRYVQGYGALIYSRASGEAAMGFEVAEVQSTPNPDAMKFVLNRRVAEQPISFFNADAAANHPLATSLFAIPGVCSVLFLHDFLTINKRPEAKWPEIKRAVRKVLGAA